MKQLVLASLLFATCCTVARADVVMPMTDAQRVALIRLIVLGTAAKQCDDTCQSNAAVLLGMIATAPVMTGQQPVPEKGSQP